MAPSSRSRQSSTKRWRGRIGFIAILALLLSIGLYGAWTLWVRPLPARAIGQVFTLRSGETIDELSSELHSRGLLREKWPLIVLTRLTHEGRRIQQGEYQIRAHQTVAGLLQMMVTGQVLLHEFTIVPGTTFNQVLNRLEKDPAVTHTLKGLTPHQILSQLGLASENSPEGLFYPNTYDFPKGVRDTQILMRAYKKMQRILKQEWKSRANKLPLHTPYQALILASVIEKETASPGIRARVAGVFIRRLRRNMHLDADPTVIYALGSAYHGNLTRQDMHVHSPYNTYLVRGLPPTPICMPSRSAIHAALHPHPGKSLYFVATENGTHVFSDTLTQQNAMIRKYLLKQPIEKKHVKPAPPVTKKPHHVHHA